MTCTACGHENRAGRKFCVECGAVLALACAACSAPYEAGEKFCGECGAPLEAAAPRPSAGVDKEGQASGSPAGRAAMDGGARKVVTIVFADLVGSTGLHERLDAESAQRVMERYYEALRAVVDAHGGTVVKLLGDGVMAAFGLKRVAEDDALRAVRAAAAMQEAFRALTRTEAAALGAAGLRIAVNTGEVVVSGARDDVIGDPVNVAARLQEQAGDGDVVVGEATRRLVATRVTLAPLGSVTLKGRAEAVAAYRLESLEPPAGATAAPFVGRESELARLVAVYDAAVATPATRLAVLLGSPGLGKSRLIDELGRRYAGDATILAAHCDAAGGATFAPLAQVLRGFLGLDEGAAGDAVRAAVIAALAAGDEGERARIAGGIAGLLGGTATSPEETFFVVRRFFAGLAAAQPVVLVIDDLHWAEPLLLDLVEHLVQWGSGVPLFVLVGARPELRDLRSSLVVPGALVADVVTLGGLDAGAAMRLAANVIGAADLPAAVAAKVLATSEGNPLFVGELVRMLVQEGALTKDGDRWIVGAGLAALEMPPTIHALLAARIERLGSEDRTVLERASVVGRHFSRSAVAALLGRNGSELDARLESLRRSELIERDIGWLLGEPVMRFHHVLIRDAAYRRLLKGTRAELHARLADWIEEQVGDAPEHDEMIGWHLEQAHRLLSELGPLDAAGAALGERAARRLAAAGRRALARDDVSLAAGLLGRALARLTADAAERADLGLDWCEALLSAGDVGPAAAAIDELDRLAAGSERLRAWHTCFAGQLTVLTAPEALHATADRVGAAARELATLEDAAGEAKAHFVHAQALARLGKIGACEAALDQALAAARRAGDRRRANAVLAGAPLAALWGPSPVTRASGRCLDVVRVLRITQGAPAVEAVALSCQGVLEALRGRTEAARRMLASSRTMVEELGISHRLYETDVFAGRIDLLEGDAPAAERALRAGYEGLRDLGLGIDAARAAALLGRALLAQGRAAEAETLSHESELLAGDDLQAAIAWRGVRAEALARHGDHAAAIAFAEAAVAIAAATDALLDHADARLALAAAFRAGGRRAEADAEERRAFELWEAKGATVLAERARRATDGEVPAAPPPETRAEPRVQRRVRPNAGSVAMARVDAAYAARDLAAMGSFAESFEEVSHPTGAAYGRDQMLLSLDRFLRLPGAKVRHELLATLGDTLWLFRRWMGAKAAGRKHFDVGEYEKEEIGVNVLDGSGAHLRNEIFAADHLGDAIALLYRRYAEGLPPGPARERATVVARAVAFILLPGETPDLNLLYAPTYKDIDHRTVGYGSLSRADADKLAGSFEAVAEDVRFRIDDVLALDPNGFVRMTTSSGVWREGGGAYERTVCTLTVFGPDGRVTGHETFEPDRAAEALARFDALTAAIQPKAPVQRRVRPNAVTRVSAELDGIVVARDFAALETYFAEAAECIDHPTGATYGAADMRTGLRRLMQSPDAHLRTIPLASLGASWGLARFEMSASGAVGGRFDVGAYEIVDVRLQGTDEHGRIRHVEIFATERLGAAIVRLYERYAESLPGGPASARARAIARSLAVFDGPIEFERIANAYAPSFEAVDRRILGTWSAQGREEELTHWRGQLGLADDSCGRYDEVLALEPGAILVHQSFWGSSRTSGGVFEVVTLVLHVFDGDGLITHTELFEPEREAQALARFDVLTVHAAPRLPVRRRVRPNAATATAARFDAAIAARDEGALADTLAEALAVVDHANGADYGRDGVLTSFQGLLRMDDPTMHHEQLATLGESLALLRRRIGGRGGRLDVGAYERDEICVCEVDADGRFRHVETFAAERLRAALVRFYERYAESLPEGPARTRASGIARSSSTYDGSIDADRIATGLALTFVCVDHRTLGTWSAQSREEWLTHWRAQGELTAGFTCRDDDILALAPTALLVRETFFGTNRIEGGLFENVILALIVFGADGLYGLAEIFEPECEGEALARFDALTAGAAPRQSVQRRVRPNAATATFAAIADAFARRDLAAVDALLGDPLETIEHPTGTRYGREGQLESSRRMMRMPDLSFRIEPLATLGDALCLARRVVSASGTGGGRFDVGAYEIESIVVNGVDAAGRLTSAEVFASDHLCQAIARLYGLYAESLPDGPERTRAAGIASSHAVWDGPIDVGRVMRAFAPSFVCVDHRSLGTWSAEGLDEWAQQWRGQTELAGGFSRRDHDILALAPGANVTRRTFLGTNRASGGPFENLLIGVDVFGADGLYTRCEVFEPNQEAEALARFDALVGLPIEPTTSTPSDPHFANAATRNLERFVRASAANDWQALADCFAPSLRFDDRRPLLRMELPKDGFLEQHRVLFDVPNGRWITTAIATRGERLVLARLLFQGDVAGGGGALEIDHLSVLEVDDGRMNGIVLFEPADLDAAYAELDARFAAGEAAGCARAWAAPCAAAAAWNARDFDAIPPLFTPDYVFQDHRRLLFGAMLSDPAVLIRSLQLMVEMAPDFRCRLDRVVCLAERGALVEAVEMGTRDGGAFETRYFWVSEVDAEGRMPRFDLYDLDQIDQARARVAELTSPAPSAEPFANAASRTDAELFRCFNARDWAGVLACAASELVFDERRRLVRNTCGREIWLEQFRLLFDVPASRFTTQFRATRGERLSLSLHCFTGEVAYGGGPLAMDDHLALHEVDGDGRIVAIVLFDLEDADLAYAELDARYAASLGDPHGRAWAESRDSAAAMNARDWGWLAAAFPPGYVAHDHRLLQWGSMLSDPAVFVRSQQLLVELAPDYKIRLDHVRVCDRGSLVQATEYGTRDGGAFETTYFWVAVVGETGGFDLYGLEQLDQARARFDALAALAPMAEPFANAATRALARMERLWVARDWDASVASFAPTYYLDDRRPLMRLRASGDEFFAQLRMVFDFPRSRWHCEPLATRGERLALGRALQEGDADESGGPFAVEYLTVFEVDAAGLATAEVMFDPADQDAAYAELDARYDAGEGPPSSGWIGKFALLFANRDWDALIAQCAPTLVEHDHRRITGVGTTRGPDAWVQKNLRVWTELAPDTIPRWKHVRGCERGALSHFCWEGSREGGQWEVPFFTVAEMDERGRLARLDLYDLDQLDQARTRFAELAAPAPSAEPFANAASATAVPVIAAIVAHDWQRFAQLLADDFRMSDRRRVVQLELDRDQYVAFTREVGNWGTGRAESELLATRGERLALQRLVYEFSGADVGPSEIAFLILTEVDARGRIVAYVRWDVEDLDAAYAELDARYEAGEGAAPAAFMRLCREAIASRDWEPVLARCAPTLVEYDHRTLAVLGTTRGAEGWVQNFRTLTELSPDTIYRVEHFRTGARGFWSVGTWHGTREGGAYEIPISAVFETDEQSRETRVDIYDPEQMDQARARFAELAAPMADRFANAATRAAERIIAYWRARDWQGLARMLPAALRFQDRRRIALLDGDRERYVEWLRVTGEMTSTKIEVELLATRGDRLALQRRCVQLAGGDVGPSEMVNVTVIATDERGDPVAVIHFDEDALDAAYAELDARWAAGEAAQHRRASTWLADYLRAFAARDWTAMTALLAPDLMGENHRLVGWGTLHGPAAIVSTLQAQIELAPDTQERLDHVLTSEHAVLLEYAWYGTREGGAFENVWLVLVELDVDGRAQQVDVWEPEQLDRARVRFAEIAARTASEAPPVRFANAATRALERGLTALGARDWAGFAALFAKDFRVDDRTSFGRFEADDPQFLTGFRDMVEMTSGPPTRQVLATRGERLVLGRVLWRGAAGDVGPSEVEWLMVIEVDERGDHLALVSFNPKDLDAAYAELDARWLAGEGAGYGATATFLAGVGTALARRDWDATAAVHAPTLEAHDHRLVGWGTLHGPAAFFETFRAMFALAPDARFRTDHLRATGRGILADCLWQGTREGGAFESPFLVVAEIDASGRAKRLDFYDPHHLNAARTRFDEIAASTPPATPAARAASAKPNAASAAMNRWQAAYDSGFDTENWDQLRAVCAPRFVFDDRRRLALVSGNVEMLVASARERAASGARVARTPLGTAGDRLVIERWLLSGGPSDGRFEIEYLGVFEVDEAGLITAFVMFDLDDARAAQREAWARWAAIDPVAAPWVKLIEELVASFDAHDGHLAHALTEDIVVDDHRRTGFGRIDGRDAYYESLEALWELAPDQRIEMGWFWPAVERHGFVTFLKRHGTLPDGGAFESEMAWLGTVTGGRINRLELFEIEDVDKAVARLAELRPDPLRIPPNAATR